MTNLTSTQPIKSGNVARYSGETLLSQMKFLSIRLGISTRPLNSPGSDLRARATSRQQSRLALPIRPENRLPFGGETLDETWSLGNEVSPGKVRV